MDDVTFTYIVDGVMWMDAHRFFPSIPPQYWRDHPDALDASGRVVMSTGGLLVERDGHRLLIDAGLGTDITQTSYGPCDCGHFLKTLRGVGLSATDIDVFALTHLHPDHTGWAWHSAQPGNRVLTFARAPYVIAEAEWAPLAGGVRPPGIADADALVELIGNHRLLTLIADGEEVAPGVATIVTPGHSAGHTSYVITSRARRRLIAFGDVFHIPAQLRHPEWGSAPDADRAAVAAARARIVDELCQPETIGFGLHFGDQPFGRIVPPGLRWQPVATTMLSVSSPR
ncbi:MBL fold metallo-hydrolase [Mycobacterium intracellulare]|uniref:MBL fold metallo-hydrolase n=1 Tax=Mycobacterium intracellulare TaxID=1767 RepID=UPI00335F101E